MLSPTSSETIDARKLVQAIRSHLGRIARSRDPVVVDARHRLEQEMKQAIKK